VQDIAWYIPPPGRFPGATNANGVADAAGNMLVWNSQAAYNFTRTGAWNEYEAMFYNATLINENWQGMYSSQSNGSYAMGFRCAHD